MTIQRKTYLVAAFFFAVLLGVYANHFDNGFEFDDFHSIVNNAYIMDINNFFLFFTDGSTITTLTGNQSYRPISTLMNAIDYWIAGEMDPFQFHLQIFFWYLMLGLMLFLFIRKCLQYAGEHPWNNMVSVFIVSWFMLHTANAETVNYIGARSDGFSTLCVIASFVLFQNSTGRKYYLYLLTMLLGIFTKQTGVMFIGLLFFYIYFFEENASLKDMFGLKRLDAFGRAFRKTLPALVVGGTIFIINQFVLTPEATNMWDVSVSKLDYFSTQWYVVLHYIGNFILPTSLSADPDLTIIQPIYDKRIIAGLILIVAMLWVSYKTSLKKETRLIAFGILWFFIALLPTSSILPRFQIANDHRTFFPYIGLVISVGWALALWLRKRASEESSSRWLTSGVAVFAAVLICGYGYGAHQRNIVWGNSELLWKDVTVKSPKNGRGLMNYGLTKMEKGEYAEALKYFKDAEKLLPTWSYLHINLAILHNATGNPELAEQYFEKGLLYGRTNAEVYYFYAKWLTRQGRKEDAIKLLQDGQALSPGHIKINAMLARMQEEDGPRQEADLKSMEELVISDPSPSNYINLSLTYYRNQEFEKCIEACVSALELDPQMAAAYNNICGAYNQLKKWELAAEACRKAIELQPDFALAKNNLRWAESEMENAATN